MALPSRPTNALRHGPYGLASTPAGKVAQVLVEQQGRGRSRRSPDGAGVLGPLHPATLSRRRQQLRSGSGMAWLTAALAATALMPCRRAKTGSIAGGRLGGAAGAAAEPLPLASVAGQFASGIPAGGPHITDGLCLRRNREASLPQGFSRAEVCVERSRTWIREFEINIILYMITNL
jgi:hypothetical protein